MMRPWIGAGRFSYRHIDWRKQSGIVLPVQQRYIIIIIIFWNILNFIIYMLLEVQKIAYRGTQETVI